MRKSKLALVSALAIAAALTVSLPASAAEVPENAGAGYRLSSPVDRGQKREALTEEQRAEMAGQRPEMAEKWAELAENGGFAGGWGKRGAGTELTEEQKAEMAAKLTEQLAQKLEAGEISQEEYDKIVAAIESGEFAGGWGMRGDRTELTEEQKAELSEKWAELAENGKAAGGWGNRGDRAELTEEQKAEMAEKRAGAAENGKAVGGWGVRVNAGGQTK